MKQSTIRIPDEMLDLVGIKRNANESTDEEDTKAIIGILHTWIMKMIRDLENIGI